MEKQVKTQAQIEQEMLELNKQFGEFLHTKGIAAKFKLAFANMGDSAKKQHEADKAQFEAVKAQSAEDNAEFAEFLHTKGLKAKFNLVVENIKKGAEAAPRRTAENIAKATARTQVHVNPHAGVRSARGQYTAESLAEEFNEFLKMKGLDTRCTVEIKDSDED